MELKELINNGADITIAIKREDLLEFFQDISSKREEQTQTCNAGAEKERYYSPKEVGEILQVDLSTLWRWEKQKYLTGIRIGGKKRYKGSDINKLLEGE